MYGLGDDIAELTKELEEARAKIKRYEAIIDALTGVSASAKEMWTGKK